MPPVPFWLYDTVVFDTTADVTHTLFQVAQGADALHTKQFTNNRSAGQLPQNESMVIKAVHASVWGEVVEADLPLLFEGNYLVLTLSDETIFQVPLLMCASHNSYGGSIRQTVAANNVAIGLMGKGLMLNPTVDLVGGDSFKIEVFQDNALSAAENMWITLEGVLTR